MAPTSRASALVIGDGLEGDPRPLFHAGSECTEALRLHREDPGTATDEERGPRRLEGEATWVVGDVMRSHRFLKSAGRSKGSSEAVNDGPPPSTPQILRSDLRPDT